MGNLDLQKALDSLSDIDAVVITTPNSLHYQHAKQVLNAGKHLILEKPIVETWEEACDLVKLLDKTGKKAMVGQTLRGEPMIRMAAHFLKEGIIGDIEQMTFNSFFWWEDDPEKVWRLKLKDMFLDDIGIHQFDEIRMLLGNRKCKSIIARTTNPKTYPLQDMKTTASASLLFEDNIHVNYFGTMSSRAFEQGWFGRIEVFGTKGLFLLCYY